MSATKLEDLVGLTFPVEDEYGVPDVGLVTAVAGWSPQYVLVQTSRGQTCRQGAHLLRHLHPVSTPTGGVAMPTATQKRPKSPPDQDSLPKPEPRREAPKKPAKKAKPPDWKTLPDSELAAYLLAHQTLPDSSWQERAGAMSRRKGEKREAFIRRALLGEKASA